MIALPWYGRLVFDTSLIFVPLITWNAYPRGFTTFLTNKRRYKRRKDYTDFPIDANADMNVEDAVSFYSQLGFKEVK